MSVTPEESWMYDATDLLERLLLISRIPLPMKEEIKKLIDERPI